MAKKILIILLLLLLPLTTLMFLTTSLITSLWILLLILASSLVILSPFLKLIKNTLKKLYLYFNSALIALSKTKIFQLIENNKFYLLAIILMISFHRFFEALFKYLLVDKAAKVPAFLTSFDNNLVTKSLFSCVIIYALIKGIPRVFKNEKIEPKTMLTTLTLGAVYYYFRITYGDASFAVFYPNDIFNIYYFDLLMLPLVGNLLLVIENTIIGILRFIRLVGVFIYLKSRRLLVRLRCAWRKAVKNFNGCTYIKRHLKMPILRCCVHIRRLYRKIHNIWKIVGNTWKKAKKRTALINPSEGFLLETPIEDEKDDLFNRKNISPQMVERIYHSANPTTSFAVGIVSQWGNGKTSFLNLMCKELKKKEPILFRFKPWVYEDKRSITYAFFSGLSQTLHPYNKSLSRHLRLYSSMLSAVDTPFTHFCSVLLMQGNDFETQHKKISNAIKNIGKPVIITIDDFDRLDEKEIAEVLKLIRNTASFPNTIYIAAYDREYIATGLKKINGYNSSQYLEKIFQLEFDLPDYDRSEMLNWMYKKLEPVLKGEEEKNKKRLESALVKEHTNEKRTLDSSYITNMREATRLINLFSTTYRFLKGEVDIVDLMAVELLHMKYPSAYNLLLKKREDFLDKKKSNYNNNDKYAFYTFSKNKKPELDELFKSDVERETVRKMISNLFPEREDNPKNIYKRIYAKRYCHLYFHYALSGNDFSELSFQEAWSGNEKTKKRIISLYNDKRMRNLAERLNKKSNQNLNSNEYENLIDFIFIAYNRTPEPYFGIPISGRERLEKILLKENIKKNFESKEALKSILEKHKDSVLTHKLLTNYVKEFNSLDYFSPREILNMQNEYLKQCFKNKKNLSDIINIMDYTNINNEKKTINQEARDNFVIYVKDHLDQLDELLPYLIYLHENLSNLYDDRILLWGSYDNFEHFINNLPQKHQTPALIEFKAFFNACKKEEFDEFLTYDFKEIKNIENNYDEELDSRIQSHLENY